MTHKSVLFRLATALFAVLFAAPMAAQDTTRVPSPLLLKRLAEAVDGHRHGGIVYVVARYDSLSRVAGVFTSRGEAQTVARRMGPTHDVFGPYLAAHVETPTLAVRQPVFGCIHDGRTSAMDICPFWAIPLEMLDSMTLTLRLRDGSTRTLDLGRSTDAVFLSIPAIDKFVIPYYERIIGVAAAAVMRHDIVARTAASQVPPP